MNVVINAAYGSWYPRGQKRLVDSLRATGYEGDILTFCDEPINEHFNPRKPYTIKAATFIEAIKKGYTNILWLDCSVWSVKNITPFFDLIERESVYFWRSGWNLAQSAADSDLEYAGWTRDEAERLYECASGMVGLNMKDNRVKQLMDIFIDANKKGVCSTSRNHDNQSQDPRFKFARQDQTALSIAYHKVGFTNEGMYVSGQYSAYTDAPESETVIFKMQGM
jgi:hypothetical protein